MYPLKARPTSRDNSSLTQGNERGIDRDALGVESGDAHDPDLMVKLKAWFKRGRDASEDWRTEAVAVYDMVAGTQYTAEDARILEEQDRPPVVFNRIGPFIDSVEGHEINNRMETRYIPRTLGDTGVNELLTEAARWVRDECDAEDEESGAVRDLVICGMGWIETSIDYSDDPDGKITISRCDPLDMVWDSAARKDNLSDGRHIFRIKSKIPIADARMAFPHAGDDELDATWARDQGAAEVHNDAPDYEGGDASDDDTGFVTQVEAQWWEYETAYRVADPATDRFFRMTEDEYAEFCKRIKTINELGVPVPKHKAIRDKRKRYYKAVLGSIVLSREDGPAEGGFLWKAMTGKRDRNNASWYGIVRGMVDPQRWANKWLSQILHVINKNAKGGLIAEAGAIINRNEFVDTWAESDSVSIVADGAISQGRIKDKPAVVFPAGLDKLMEFAIASIPATAGINPEMLGQTTSMQPGVAAAEMGRKQQAMAILAGMFNAKRRYAKEQGRLLLWMIQEFLPAGKLIRIGGAENARYVPMAKQDATIRYDVIVDDTPTSPNMKEKTWGMLLQLMPALRQMPLPPEVWLELMKYSPLPESLTGKITKIVEEAAKNASPGDPAAAAFAEAEKAKAQKLQAETAAKLAELQMAPARLEMDREMMASKIEQQRAAAIASLVKAEATKAGVNLEALEAAARSLLTAQDQEHTQARADRDQAHAQALARQKDDHARGLADRAQDHKERSST
jgi:hypothetical protein